MELMQSQKHSACVCETNMCCFAFDQNVSYSIHVRLELYFIFSQLFVPFFFHSVMNSQSLFSISNEEYAEIYGLR